MWPVAFFQSSWGVSALQCGPGETRLETHDVMTKSPRRAAVALALLLAAAAGASPLEIPMHTATGPFDVQLSPEPASAAAEAAGLGRMSLDKSFHGDLQARSRGEMIAFRSATPGSAGYVAMETVRGSLAGLEGSFVLQHSSTLDRGQPVQSITVVPDSGTGALSGLAGRMVIDIAPGGAHSYRFEYTLPAR
jgi:hypothetical protein